LIPADNNQFNSRNYRLSSAKTLVLKRNRFQISENDLKKTPMKDRRIKRFFTTMAMQ
jgi:hypothetical protein